LSSGRILVIDDEPQIRRIMRETLTAAGYEVEDARNGAEGLDKLREFHPDLVLLDINMPEIGGVEVCKSDADKVAALDAGADDFITKPFSTPELLARVRAALRRVPVLSGSSSKLQFGELVIDFGARTVARRSTSTHLTPKELDVLRHLTQHANEAVSHRELLQSVWGPDYGDQVDYLRVVIKNLRKKIEVDPEHPHYIKTEPWVGYRFDTSPD
jgi:two-component system KDP operon response regulator KdpE